MKRQIIRSSAAQPNISKSSVHRITKENRPIRPYSNTIEPLSTEKNKLERIRYCLRRLQLKIIPPLQSAVGSTQFESMMDEIHIDKICFHINKNTRRFHLPERETPHQRTTKVKRFIKKVMFMDVVAQSCLDTYRNQRFD